MKKLIALTILVGLEFFSFTAFAMTPRWSVGLSRQWQGHQGWVVGSNYIPVDAVNQLEMWQKETFNPAQINRELSKAELIGMNSMRVFLHDLVWQEDPRAFAQRINTFLTIAERHHIKPLFVLFDSCWDPKPRLGPQRPPTPGVHNSGWVQSPGIDAVLDESQILRLQAYVKGVIGAFAKDRRILGWDLWNEPDGMNNGSYGDPAAKARAVEKLLPQVFEWARSVQPIQPLTSGVWTGDWSSDDKLRPIEKIQLGLSDIITFHSYEPADKFEAKIQSLIRFGRPVLCTEYMARTLGSTIQTILPLAKKYGVGAFNWGFVAGKTQTFYPWDSWQHPYPAPPPIWFHDLFYPNGQPFDANEIKVIENLTHSRRAV